MLNDTRRRCWVKTNQIMKENKLQELRSKFAHEIKLYGITSVTVSGCRVYYESAEKLPYELFNSIECFLL